MSTWYINKNGVSLNEGGKYVTFSFVRLKKDDRGKWLLRFYVHIPFSKKDYWIDSFVNPYVRYL